MPLKACACQLCHVKLSETDLNAVCCDAGQDNEAVNEGRGAQNRSEVLTNALKFTTPQSHTQGGGPTKALFTSMDNYLAVEPVREERLAILRIPSSWIPLGLVRKMQGLNPNLRHNSFLPQLSHIIHATLYLPTFLQDVQRQFIRKMWKNVYC